jgi:hypothetical protein
MRSIHLHLFSSANAAQAGQVKKCQINLPKECEIAWLKIDC